jgi:hypothetical protein
MRIRGWGAVLASMLLLAVVFTVPDAQGSPPPPNLCHPETPALAHHANGVVLNPQPTGGPMPCRSYTGFPGGESRIEVTNTGTVMFSPAPYLRGIGSVGYGPDEEETAPQWMFQNGGIAVSDDGGASWTRELPLNSSWTMDDALSFYDRPTGTYFWMPLNSSPFPNVEEGGPGPREQGVLTESRILSSTDEGDTWRIGSAVGVISDRAPLIVAHEPLESGTTDVAYFCHVFGTNMGTCSTSLDGGVTWTVAGRSHGIGVHPYCNGAQEGTGRSGWHSLAPMPDGSVVEIVTCNGQAYLARTRDRGATWPIERPLPHAGDLRSDSAGNLYLVEFVAPNELLLSISDDAGETWSDEIDVTMPGVDQVQSNWYYTVDEPGRLTFTYNGRRSGSDVFDGFITATRSTLEKLGVGSNHPATAVFWSAQINDPGIPLMYGDSIQGVGIPVATNPLDGSTTRTPPPQTNQLGAAIDPTTGNPWASFTEDCGRSPEADRCQAQHNQTRGVAAWFHWPGALPPGRSVARHQ